MEKKFTYSPIEVKLAKSLIEQSEKDRNNEVFQRTIKRFINDTESATVIDCEGKLHKICLPLIIARSKPLKKMYQYDGVFKFPVYLIDEFHLTNKVSTSSQILDVLTHADIFNIKTNAIDYKTITVQDLFDYVQKTKCANINVPIMNEIRKGLLIWCTLYELFGMWAIMSGKSDQSITEIYNIIQNQIDNKTIDFYDLFIKNMRYDTNFYIMHRCFKESSFDSVFDSRDDDVDYFRKAVNAFAENKIDLFSYFQ